MTCRQRINLILHLVKAADSLLLLQHHLVGRYRSLALDDGKAVDKDSRVNSEVFILEKQLHSGTKSVVEALDGATARHGRIMLAGHEVLVYLRIVDGA